MNREHIVRRLTGAIRIAVAWGVVWGALSFVAMLAARTVGLIPDSVSVLDAVGMAIRIGIMGGMTGGAFSILISLLYRGRRLSEISAARFGIGGAIVACLFVLTFMTAGNLFTGDPMPPFEAIRMDLVMAALFGGVAAGGSMWLAQRGEVRPGAPDEAREGARERATAGR